MSLSLCAQNIVKRYAGVVALSDGNLEVNSGEVVALIGANGSGKSTLSKIITGVVALDQGQLLLDGLPVQFSSPQAAKKMGITAVYQELSLIPQMTVAENIWLSKEPLKAGGLVNTTEIKHRTEELLALFGDTFHSSLNPDVQVASLHADEKQIVEIIKAINLQPRIIILDEATASLDSRQVQRLFELVSEWKTRGMAVVFVSHRMDEIFRIADRFTVLRNGRTVGSGLMGEINEREIVELMIQDADASKVVQHDRRTAKSFAGKQIRLSVEDLKTNVLKGISFEVHDGELLGIGGLQGQGQRNLLHTIFGDIPYTGTITISGERVHFTHPRQAIKKGVALVPGDRAREGLLFIRSILENLMLPSWKKYGSPLRIKKARQDADRIARDLSLVMSELDSPVSSLSGGNAQKVVIGKWLLRNPRLLLLDDPTKGVDVGTKAEFYKLLSELSEQGTTILFYSSDDEELLGLCDRVLVLHDGAIHSVLAGDRLTRSNLVAASMGAVNGVGQ